jgi:hypothetical protein
VVLNEIDKRTRFLSPTEYQTFSIPRFKKLDCWISVRRVHFTDFSELGTVHVREHNVFEIGRCLLKVRRHDQTSTASRGIEFDKNGPPAADLLVKKAVCKFDDF